MRFDRNSYSIPHTHVRRPLTLLASATTVRLIAGTDEIARHARSYDTGQTIEEEAHVAGLVAATRQANPSSARDRLRLAVPAIATLLDRLAARGESLRAHTARLLALLDDYGPQELAAAVARRARARRPRRRRHRPHSGNASPAARAEAADPARLARSARASAISTSRPHRLESYDDLTRSDPDDPE